jgi:hypothetical protein
MHYANGREAHVGDPVVGKVYNTRGIVAGTLVSLTPGPDVCSAQVEWTAVARKDEPTPRMATTFGGSPVVQPYATRGSEQHGAAGAPVELWICRDYTHAGYLLHAEDAHSAALPAPPADHPAASDQA